MNDHPIYQQALVQKRAGKSIYLDPVDVAKLLREKLKQQFPGVKFRIRTSKYAGGSSIDIRWIGGPSRDEVDAIADRYQFADFCGMNDLKLHRQNWLLPDGSMSIAFRGASSRDGDYPESVIADPPSAQALLIGGGADYISAYRLTEEDGQ
jgi:hypothetical protein